MRMLITASVISLLAAPGVASSRYVSQQAQTETIERITMLLPRDKAKLRNQTPIPVAGVACGNDGGTCPDGYVCCSNAIFQYWCVRSGESC